MRPREAQVAFVLEAVPGVLGVFSIARSDTHLGGYELAVQVESAHAGGHVHAALLFALRPEECHQVWVCHTALPPSVAARATRLVLTRAEREAARQRVSPGSSGPFVLPLPNVAPAPLVPSAPPAPPERRRKLSRPTPSPPFKVLAVDVEEDVHEALRSVVRCDARHVMRGNVPETAELALTSAFHLIVCSARAALSSDGFLTRIAREDKAGAARIIVLAAARDVPWMKRTLQFSGTPCRVLALPIDEVLLRRAALRDLPDLVTRIAVAEAARTEAEPIRRPTFRRLRVLVIDEDQTTHILHAAAAERAGHDTVLATSSVEAFEQLVSNKFDLVLCSASLRDDSGEPFYRTVWRMKPELKTRCVLVAAADMVPASSSPASGARSMRIVERPLTRVAIARVVDAFTSS